MPTPLSNYYPPRARDRLIPRALATPLDRAWMWVRVKTRRLPVSVSALNVPAEQWLLAMLLPGYAYLLLGRRNLAWLMVAGWCFGALLFLVFLGYPWITGWALGGLASAHSSGQGYLILREREQNPMEPPIGLAERLWIPLACWAVCLLVIYWPASEYFQRRVARPLPVGDRVIVFHAADDPGRMARGEFVAYRIGEDWVGNVRVASGLSTGLVLAIPGDEVEFDGQEVRVNGVPKPRMDFMPFSGALTVEPGTRFIWPVLNERVVNVERSAVDAAYLRAARVPEANLIGRPFRRWFFRNQQIP